MPILIECANCKRKLRVLDHLLGKMVKCPNCKTKILAQSMAETAKAALSQSEALEPDVLDSQPASASIEDLMRTPVVPPLNPATFVPLQALEVTEPASSPPTAPSPKPRPSEQIATTVAPAPAAAPLEPPPANLPPVPAPLERFETPPLRVLSVVAIIIVVAALIGFIFGWWVGAAVENAAAEVAREAQ
jgi:DNA-directed RNA polymerase subunit RPC12/RpoP